MSDRIWTIRQAVDLSDAPRRVTAVEALMVPGDDEAHEWRIDVTKGGEAVPLSDCAATAYFERADRGVPFVRGAIAEGGVTFRLPRECYAVPGPLLAVARLTVPVEGDSPGAVRVLTLAMRTFRVEAALSDRYVDPGEVLPSIDELLAHIDTIEQAASVAVGIRPSLGPYYFAPLALTWRRDRLLDADGTTRSYAGYKCTAPIPVSTDHLRIVPDSSFTAVVRYACYSAVGDAIADSYRTINGPAVVPLPAGTASVIVCAADENAVTVTDDRAAELPEVLGLPVKLYIDQWNADGYVSAVNGAVVAYQNWVYSDPIPVNGGRILDIVSDAPDAGSAGSNAFYDAGGAFIESFSILTGRVPVPAHAAAMRVSRRAQDAVSLRYSYGDTALSGLSALHGAEAALEARVGALPIALGWTAGGYVDSETGRLITSGDNIGQWLYTGYIPVEGVRAVDFALTGATGAGSAIWTGFYSALPADDTDDAAAKFLGFFNMLESPVVVPTRARYMRVSRFQTVGVQAAAHVGGDLTTGLHQLMAERAGYMGAVTLNKDVEPLVVQAKYRNANITRATDIVSFLHLSDIHRKQELWNRAVDYLNHYADYLDFGICTGDYCNGYYSEYTDLYGRGPVPTKPLYLCDGNHDTMVSGGGTIDAATVYSQLYSGFVADWGDTVTFGESGHMYYLRDFAEAKLRVIVLDNYYDASAQAAWLTSALAWARTNAYAVVTLSHEVTGPIVEKFDTPFQTLENFEAAGGGAVGMTVKPFDAIIAAHVRAGGAHVAHLCGHEHSGYVGKTARGIMNICVPAATDWLGWTDGNRVKGTKSWDCFHVVSVDVAGGLLRVARVGANADDFGRQAVHLTWDFAHGRLESECRDAAARRKLDAMAGGTVYGFHIDATEADPSACVTYLKDCAGFTPAAMDFANDTFVWGNWRGAFFLPRPCMLRYDGTVDYYLDPDDYTRKADGVTPSDVADDAYAGNAMMEWGQGGKRIWYKIVPDAGDSASASVYIADWQADADYQAWSFINAAGEMVEHFYTPIFNGTLDSGGKLRSISGKTYAELCQSKTVAEEIAAAELCNPGSDKIWYTEVYADVTIINLLLILMGKSLDTQAVFGNGRINQTASAENMLGTGTMNDKGLFWGGNGNNDGVKVFGMENWWGNQWRRYAGHVMIDYVQKYKMTRGREDGSAADDYADTGTSDDYAGYLTGATGPNANGFVRAMRFDANGFQTGAVGGASADSSHYWCDYWYQDNGLRYALRGGDCGRGLNAGAFCVRMGIGPTTANWAFGAAPSCKPMMAQGV